MRTDPTASLATDPSAKRPFARRSRPIDATGLFWGFVSVLAGLFYGRIFGSIWFDVIGTAAAMMGVLWQFQKWSFDSAVHRNAVKWCQSNYPHLANTPIVDFVVAYCQVTFCDVDQLTPASQFNQVDLEMGANSLMEFVLREARISRADVEDFTGITLGEAIEHAIRPSRAD